MHTIVYGGVDVALDALHPDASQRAKFPLYGKQTPPPRQLRPLENAAERFYRTVPQVAATTVMTALAEAMAGSLATQLGHATVCVENAAQVLRQTKRNAHSLLDLLVGLQEQDNVPGIALRIRNFQELHDAVQKCGPCAFTLDMGIGFWPFSDNGFARTPDATYGEGLGFVAWSTSIEGGKPYVLARSPLASAGNQGFVKIGADHFNSRLLDAVCFHLESPTTHKAEAKVTPSTIPVPPPAPETPANPPEPPAAETDGPDGAVKNAELSEEKLAAEPPANPPEPPAETTTVETPKEPEPVPAAPSPAPQPAKKEKHRRN